MSSRVSPGGALLRTSRMFSLPKSIPSAAPPPTHGTAPHPTQQAITTLEWSRKTGDWGLKRPLPLKTTTKSSTPAVRVKQIDCSENVTDFASASGHTLTLQKFQELNLPLTVPSAPSTYSRSQAIPEGTSVFEEDGDAIAAESLGPNAVSNDRRWKFSGPWLAGMDDGEFNAYLRRTVRNRRQEFRQFLRGKLAVEKNTEAQNKALEQGIEVPPPVEADAIPDTQLTDYIRKLRSDRITLYTLVGEFLDLAPLNPPSAVASMSAGARIQSQSTNPYASRGPPASHPSGGLSYLRTAAIAENHPLYGPQANPAPVESRIMSPRVMSHAAKLGVAGFITDTPLGDSAFNAKQFRNGKATSVPGVTQFDPTIEGGAKALVEPRSAIISASGKVVIKVDESPEEAQLIAKELLGKGTIYNDAKGYATSLANRQQALNASPSRRMSRSFKTGFRDILKKPDGGNII